MTRKERNSRAMGREAGMVDGLAARRDGAEAAARFEPLSYREEALDAARMALPLVEDVDAFVEAYRRAMHDAMRS